MCEISVAVPSYNGEKYLRETIDSLLAQTFVDIELILVDDGSTDGTPEIMDGYAAKDSRVKVIHQKNGGISKAREAGYFASTGNYFMMADDDDVWAPNVLEILLADMKRFPEADGAVAYARILRSNESDKISSHEWGTEEDKVGESVMVTGKEFIDIKQCSQGILQPCSS